MVVKSLCEPKIVLKFCVELVISLPLERINLCIEIFGRERDVKIDGTCSLRIGIDDIMFDDCIVLPALPPLMLEDDDRESRSNIDTDEHIDDAEELDSVGERTTLPAPIPPTPLLDDVDAEDVGRLTTSV